MRRRGKIERFFLKNPQKGPESSFERTIFVKVKMELCIIQKTFVEFYAIIRKYESV